MNDSKISIRDTSQHDDLKKLIEQLTKLSNKINEYLIEFEKKMQIDDKKSILNQLNSLIIQFNEVFKIAQNQYCLADQEIKKMYLEKIKQFFHTYKTHCENVTQKRNIYNILKRSSSIKEIEIDIDFEDENKHLLDYSKINTLTKNASLVVRKTDTFIKELEEEIKTKSIINPDEPGYQNYLQYQKIKKDLVRQNNLNTIKYITLFILLFAVIISILYYIIVENKIDEMLRFKD